VTYKQVIHYINRHKYEGGYTFVEMAERTGVSRTTISRFLNGDDMGVKNFFKLLKGLNIEFEIEDF
jgi:transcriptional regulator with XRE-family HTH domain